MAIEYFNYPISKNKLGNKDMRDLSMEHAAAGLTNTSGLDDNLTFPEKEIELLQELAKKVEELSRRPIEEEKRKRWTAHTI